MLTRSSYPFALALTALAPMTANAQDWRQSYPAAMPNARTGCRMACDVARNELVLFGGQSPTPATLNETWTWNGSNWTQRSPANSPSARIEAAMAWDATRQRVVLYGGQSGVAVLGDTWEWNGTTWTQMAPATTPPARLFAGFAWDGARTLLFGGGNSSLPRNDTWSWNGTNWTQLATASAPSPRYYNTMASNGAGEAILFGGFDPTLGYQNSTWRFDGTNWSQISPATQPSARGVAGMTWDPVHSRYLLWGGADSFFTTLEDTWSFAGGAAGQWTQLTTARSPSSRARFAAAWYAPQQRFVVFGGTYLQNANLRSTPMWEFGSSLASFVRFAPSVCPSLDPPVLNAISQPTVGGVLQTRLESVVAIPGFVIMGLSNTAWSGGGLPYDLSAIGTQPGCFLQVSTDATLFLGVGTSLPWSLTIPNVPAYVGTQFYVQGFNFGQGTFPTNLGTSNAAAAVVDLF
jgi:hypothetical protein